jgi:hypothetical protein
MAVERLNDLRAFRDFADQQLVAGGTDLKLDEALDRWEYENSSEAEREETIRAIERGLDDIHAGRTLEAFEFVERMRQKFGSDDQQ